MNTARMWFARGARTDFGSASEAFAARVPPSVAMRPFMTAVGAASGAAAGSAVGGALRSSDAVVEPEAVAVESAIVPLAAALKSLVACVRSALRDNASTILAVTGGMVVSGVAVWAYMARQSRLAQASAKPNLDFPTGDRIICLSSNTEDAQQLDPVAHLHVGSCIVCFSAPCSIVLNCGHMCMCSECADMCTKCPACAIDITRRLRVREACSSD